MQRYTFKSDGVKISQIRYFIIFPLDDSVVLKVITIYNKDTDTMEEVLLEELQVFKVCYLQHHSPSPLLATAVAT